MEVAAIEPARDGCRITTVVTVDPGMTGAVAVAFIEIGQAHARLIDFLDVFDMPLRQDASGDNHVDFRGLCSRISRHGPEFGLIELQHAMRKQSATASWKQCEAYRDAFNALQVACPSVSGAHGRVWKPALGLTSDKQVSLDLARHLFPAHAGLLRRKKDDGRAEAMLLAEYGCREIYTREAIEVF